MYLSAAGALVEEARQAVIANNIANASTVGYKADAVAFRRRLTEAREGVAPGPAGAVTDSLSGGALVDEVKLSSGPGPLTATGQPFDLALRGDGFFVVSDGASTLYTRAGNFRLDKNGYLTTADGKYNVLGTDGKPIRVPPGTVSIGSSGEIDVDGKRAGQLLLQGSIDPARFRKAGATYYAYVGKGAPGAARPEVLQGFLEGSNVSAVAEMANLIQSHRAYEANLQMARIQDGSLGRGVQEIGKVSA